MKSKVQKPHMKCSGDLVVGVNEEFVQLTGFGRNEIEGRTLDQVAEVLRTIDQMDLASATGSFEVYIFTKELQPVKVCVRVICEAGERTYCFYRYTNSLINEKFGFAEQFYTDKRTKISLVAYPHFILLKANDNYFEDENYSKEKLRNYNIGRNQAFVIMKNQIDNCDEFYKKIIDSRETFHIEECEYEDEKGISYWNISIVPICIDGKMELFVQARLDVTEEVMARRQLEEQAGIIRQQKEELETIIENISEAMIIYDKSGKATKINKAARDMISRENGCEDVEACFHRLSFHDMKGKPVCEEDSVVRRVSMGERVSDRRLQYKSKEGSRFMEINGTPVFDDKGEFTAGILCCRDITEKTKSQEMYHIKNQYEILNQIIENLDMTVIRLTYPDFRIKDMNHKVLSRITRIRPWIKSIDDIHMLELSKVTNEAYYKEICEDIGLLVKNGWNSYMCNKKRLIEGEERHSKFIYQPVRDLNSEIVEIALLGVDVTQEVKARNQIEHNMKQQEELFANISHELKTPLNVIFSIAQLFEFYLANQSVEENIDKVAGGVQTMKQNCYRLTRLISNIVDMSKLESGFMKLNLVNENIVSVTEEIVQSVAGYVKDMGMNIIFDTDVEEKIIACDPDKIERILLNLISNAIKFAEKGNEIFVNVQDCGDSIEISVQDNGIGIEPGKLEVIFDRYHQVDKSFVRNMDGSGIGLSLVKSIVELHGGEISAKSVLGQGSVFNITLPARTVTEEQSKKPQRDEANLRKIGMINIEFSDIYDISQG